VRAAPFALMTGWHGGGPDHVTVLTDQADRSDGLVLAFLGTAAIVFPDANAAGAIAATGGVIAQAFTRARADLRVRVDAFRGLEGIGEDIVVARAFENSVGLVFVFGNDELFGIVQAGHEQVAKLERRIAPGEDRDVNPANLAQVFGGFLFGRLLFQVRREK